MSSYVQYFIVRNPAGFKLSTRSQTQQDSLSRSSTHCAINKSAFVWSFEMNHPSQSASSVPNSYHFLFIMDRSHRWVVVSCKRMYRVVCFTLDVIVFITEKHYCYSFFIYIYYSLMNNVKRLFLKWWHVWKDLSERFFITVALFNLLVATFIQSR